MSDYKRLLRDWIEDSAEPVSADEAIRRASERAQRRRGLRYNWIAAVAAAAVVLLLIGLPILILQPSSPTEPEQSSETTASADIVPIWEGRMIEEVRLEADRLGIVLDEERILTKEVAQGTVIRQDPAPGQRLGEDRTVVVGVAEKPADTGSTTSAPRAGDTCPVPGSAPQPDKRYVSVFYGCQLSLHQQVQPLLRAIPAESSSLEEAAFGALLAGPSTDETEAGIETRFGEDTVAMLASVTFNDGKITVDLLPAIQEVSLSDSDVTSFFATGFQFETTAQVELTIDGSCEAFARWSGWNCSLDADTWWQETSTEVIAGWPVVVVRPDSVAGTCEVPTPEPGPGTMAVTVLYSCRTGEDELLHLAPVTRLVPAGSDPLVATLMELVKGANGTELAAGVSGSFLSESTTRMIKSVTVAGSRLIVDFRPFVRSPAISNIGTSTGGLVFNTILNANIFQYPDIEEIEYRVDGSCDQYWQSFEALCSIQTREGFERALNELS